MIKCASVNTNSCILFFFIQIHTYNYFFNMVLSKRMQPVHDQFTKGIVNKNIMDQIRTKGRLISE